MSAPNDGGPAFPQVCTEYAHADGGHVYGNTYSIGGMSLRAWFAGQSLAGLRARDLLGAGERNGNMNMHVNHATVAHLAGASDHLARIAVKDADAMLRALEEEA